MNTPSTTEPVPVTLTTSREAAEELQKLARSRKRAFLTLANSPLPGQRRHAEKRKAQAAEWEQVEGDCAKALAPEPEWHKVEVDA